MIRLKGQITYSDKDGVPSLAFSFEIENEKDLAEVMEFIKNVKTELRGVVV